MKNGAAVKYPKKGEPIDSEVFPRVGLVFDRPPRFPEDDRSQPG